MRRFHGILPHIPQPRKKMKAEKGRKALVIMDMQPKNGSAVGKKKIVPNQVAVLEYCIRLGVAVIIIEFSGCGATHRRLRAAASGYDNAYFIEKTSWSAFDGTAFENLLRRLDVGSFVLGGVEAEVCLLETAREGLARGYEIAVCGDLTAGYGRSKRYSGPNRRDLWQPIGVVYFDAVGSAYRYLSE